MGRGKALGIYPLILFGFNVFLTLYVPTIPAIRDLGHFLNIKKPKSLAQISLYNTGVYLFAPGLKKFIVSVSFRLGLIQQLNNSPLPPAKDSVSSCPILMVQRWLPATPGLWASWFMSLKTERQSLPQHS